MNTVSIHVRLVEAGDIDAVWRIFHAVVSRGDTYVWSPDTSHEDFLRLWMNPAQRTYVALRDGVIVGTYILKPNQPDLGAHVANAAYMVAPDVRGGGIGSALCAHSLAEARALGYRGMQFNFVVSSNTGAIRLWQRHGFRIVGTVPGAFHRDGQAYVDVHVMYREL